MDSPNGLANSQNLLISRSTFDELATALAGCSRAPSPDPVSLSCCCKREECECCQAWQKVRSSLEVRLNLAAKVGQALLEKHEAYVKAHAKSQANPATSLEELQSQVTQLEADNTDMNEQLRLAQEHSLLLESAHTSTVAALQKANEEITRLTTMTARSAGWEGKLRTLQSQNEDLRQELDYARKAEGRVITLEAQCERLLEENMRLKADLSNMEHNIRSEREASARDARVRLQNLLASIPRVDPDIYMHNQEVMKILENLVADNEALKRANAESANLLAETREELRSALTRTEEEDPIPEIDILPSPSRRQHRLNHRNTASITSFASITRRRIPRQDTDSSNLSTRRSSPDCRGSSPEIRYSRLPPQLQRLQLPGEDSSDLDSQGKPKSPMKTLMLLTRERAVQTDPYPFGSRQASPRRGGHLSPTLFAECLSLSRPSTSTAHSIHSSNSDRERDRGDTSFSPSSISQSLNNAHTPMAALTASLAALLSKLKQADVETIYTRLRRQHLSPTKESLKHILDGTVKSLDSSIRELVMPSYGSGGPAAFSIGSDGERITTTSGKWEGTWVSREEWRVLLGWCRSVLSEAVLLRALVNEADLREFGREKGGGWIKPISRLFSGSGGQGDSSSSLPGSTAGQGVGIGVGPSPLSHPHGSHGTHPLHAPKPVRPAPKLQPALAPSTTTVNVEFTGAGSGVRHRTPDPEMQVRRAKARAATEDVGIGTSTNKGGATPTPSLHRVQSQAVRGIFAGSRLPTVSPSGNDWVVLPRKSSRMFRSGPPPSGQNEPNERNNSSSSPLMEQQNPRSNLRRRMSRNLDAILDVPGHGSFGLGMNFGGPTRDEADVDRRPTASADDGEDEDEIREFNPARPLRPRGRGLSDSSIHTTFMQHGISQIQVQVPDDPPHSPISPPPDKGGRFPAIPISIPHIPIPDRASMFQALSHRVQTFASSVSGTISNDVISAAAQSSQTPPPPIQVARIQSPSRERDRGRGLSSSPRTWAVPRNLSRVREGPGIM